MNKNQLFGCHFRTPLIYRLYHHVHASLVNFLIYMICQQKKVLAFGLPMHQQESVNLSPSDNR